MSPIGARRLAATWNAFLEAETTAIENVAVRRRQEWDRVLREQYAAERRAAMKIVT